MGKIDGMDPKLVRQLLDEVRQAAKRMRSVDGQVTRLLSSAVLSQPSAHRPAQVADSCDELVHDVSTRLALLEKQEKQAKHKRPDEGSSAANGDKPAKGDAAHPPSDHATTGGHKPTGKGGEGGASAHGAAKHHDGHGAATLPDGHGAAKHHDGHGAEKPSGGTAHGGHDVGKAGADGDHKHDAGKDGAKDAHKPDGHGGGQDDKADAAKDGQKDGHKDAKPDTSHDGGKADGKGDGASGSAKDSDKPGSAHDGGQDADRSHNGGKDAGGSKDGSGSTGGDGSKGADGSKGGDGGKGSDGSAPGRGDGSAGCPDMGSAQPIDAPGGRLDPPGVTGPQPDGGAGTVEPTPSPGVDARFAGDDLRIIDHDGISPMPDGGAGDQGSAGLVPDGSSPGDSMPGDGTSGGGASDGAPPVDLMPADLGADGSQAGLGQVAASPDDVRLITSPGDVVAVTVDPGSGSAGDPAEVTVHLIMDDR
jgi:hypothetical protein